MSDNDLRDELCEAMRAISRTSRTMRFGQLMAAAGEVCSDLHGRGLWEAEDRELLEAIWKLNGDLEQQSPIEVNESS
jgi:hypothetical protein